MSRGKDVPQMYLVWLTMVTLQRPDKWHDVLEWQAVRNRVGSDRSNLNDAIIRSEVVNDGEY
jgi:hypothetical protein